MSVVPQLKELREALGSWPKVEKLLNMDDRQRRRIVNEPGYAGHCNQVTRGRVAKAVAARCPFPLTHDYLLQARDTLTELKAETGSKELKAYLIVLDGFLNSCDPEDQLLLYEFKYLRVLVSMSKGLHHGSDNTWFGGRTGWIQTLQDGETTAVSGLELADELLATETSTEKRKNISRLRAFLFINWIQIIQEQAKAEYRDRHGVITTRQRAHKFFRDIKSIDTLKEVVRAYPYLWRASFNGLEHASELELDDDAQWFYSQLKEVDPGFQDFDYAPAGGEILSISAEPGMAYFSAKFREKLHISNNKPGATDEVY